MQQQTLDELLAQIGRKGGEVNASVSKLSEVEEEAIRLKLIEEVPIGIWDTNHRLTDLGRARIGMPPRPRTAVERLFGRILAAFRVRTAA